MGGWALSLWRPDRGVRNLPSIRLGTSISHDNIDGIQAGQPTLWRIGPIGHLDTVSQQVSSDQWPCRIGLSRYEDN